MPMTFNFRALLAALLLVCACDRSRGAAPRGGESAAASGTGTTPATASALPHPQAVAILDAGARDTTFALVPGTCVQKSCPAEIALLASGKRLDAVPLEFAASDAKLTAQSKDASFTTIQALTTYSAGEGEGLVTTLMQPVRLSTQRMGVLVQQAAGFEHVKRRRDLFIVEDKKLKKVWSKQDGSGPVRSYADVIRGSADVDAIVLIEGSSFAPAEPDQVTALRLTWDEQAKAVHSSPVETMMAVVVGNFANAEAARGKLADACLANYWIIGGDQVGEKPKRFVLALLTADSSAATLNTKTNHECSRKDVQRIARFRPKHENNR